VRAMVPIDDVCLLAQHGCRPVLCRPCYYDGGVGGRSNGRALRSMSRAGERARSLGRLLALPCLFVVLSASKPGPSFQHKANRIII